MLSLSLIDISEILWYNLRLLFPFMLIPGIVALVRYHRYGDTLNSAATFLCGMGFGIYLIFSDTFYSTVFSSKIKSLSTDNSADFDFIYIILTIALLIFTWRTVNKIDDDDNISNLKKSRARFIICLLLHLTLPFSASIILYLILV